MNRSAFFIQSYYKQDMRYNRIEINVEEMINVICKVRI